MDYEVLDSLSPADRARVLAQCPAQRYGRGETLACEGELGEAFHLIESGRVALRVTTAAGEINTLSVLGAGQSFGEMALVGQRPRTATVVALERVTTLVMSRELFTALRLAHPGVDRLLVDILASRVDRLSQQLSEALYLPVEVRLARRLITLNGVYQTGTGAVVVPLTQQDIAGLVGTTRPTVNLLLNRLATDRVIELSRGTVTILDLGELARRAA